MANGIFRLNRRELMAGLGATLLGPAVSPVAAQGDPSLAWQAKADLIALRPGAPATPIWSLQGAMPDPVLRFRRGDAPEVTLENGLPVATALSWRGIDGVAAAEPLTARAPLTPGGRETSLISWRQAGTFLCDIRLLGDGQARPSSARAVIVEGRSSALRSTATRCC